MSTAIEIVRFEVARERQPELVAGHLDARRAIHAVAPPGALWSRLTRYGERGWLEIVAWNRREAFERALDAAPSDPRASAWFALADPGWTILMGEVAAASSGAPPRQGHLELSWVGRGDGGGDRDGDGSGDAAKRGGSAGSAAGAPWSTWVEIDGRAWVDPSGWVSRRPGALVVTATDRGAGARGGSAPAPPDPTAEGASREVVEIAHAVDAGDERGKGE